MQDPEVMRWVIAGLWGLTAVLMAWTWVPALLSALGGTRYQNGGEEDPGPLAPSAAEPDYAFWHDQFRALGYEPMGHGFMRLVHAADRWVEFHRVRVFHSRQKRRYGFVQKGHPPFDVWLIASFATCLNDGGLAVTSNVELEEPVNRTDYVHFGKPTHDLAELEEVHEKILARMRETQPWPDADQSLENLLRRTDEYAGPQLRENFRRAGKKYLTVNALFHLCVSLPTAVILGPGHWGLPLSNLLLYTLLRFGNAAHQSQLASEVRQKLLELRREQVRGRGVAEGGGSPGGTE